MGYDEDEKKLMKEIQDIDGKNGGGCFVGEEEDEGKEEGKGDTNETIEETEKRDDDHETKEDTDSDKVIENDDNDDKDSGIGNENLCKENGGKNSAKSSAKSSAKNNDKRKSLNSMSDSEMANLFNKNKENSEMPVVSKDEYENLEEALERFNSAVRDQPIEGKVHFLLLLGMSGVLNKVI